LPCWCRVRCFSCLRRWGGRQRGSGVVGSLLPPLAWGYRWAGAQPVAGGWGGAAPRARTGGAVAGPGGGAGGGGGGPWVSRGAWGGGGSAGRGAGGRGSR